MVLAVLMVDVDGSPSPCLGSFDFGNLPPLKPHHFETTPHWYQYRYSIQNLAPTALQSREDYHSTVLDLLSPLFLFVPHRHFVPTYLTSTCTQVQYSPWHWLFAAAPEKLKLVQLFHCFTMGILSILCLLILSYLTCTVLASSTSAANIEHVVLLVMENRPFDL